MLKNLDDKVKIEGEWVKSVMVSEDRGLEQ